MPNFTHRELCFKAAKYLKSNGIQKYHRCPYVVCELERVGESPDAFGFGNSTTQLIEVKVSRNDFLSDKKKHWRLYPHKGLATYRSYLCHINIIIILYTNIFIYLKFSNIFRYYLVFIIKFVK
jgi:hypothetical protein